MAKAKAFEFEESFLDEEFLVDEDHAGTMCDLQCARQLDEVIVSIGQ